MISFTISQWFELAVMLEDLDALDLSRYIYQQLAGTLYGCHMCGEEVPPSLTFEVGSNGVVRYLEALAALVDGAAAGEIS